MRSRLTGRRLASQLTSWFSTTSSCGSRSARQAALLQLPPYPTTTIGSFPQTPELRRARKLFKEGELTAADYDTADARRRSRAACTRHSS